MDNEMSFEARRVIELTRAARTPRAEDKERVRRTLVLSLGAGAAAAPGIADGALAATKVATATTAGTAAKVAGIGATATLKVALSAAIVASVGAGAYVWTGLTKSNMVPSSIVEPAISPAPERAEKLAPASPSVPEAAPATTAPTKARDPLLAEVALLHKAQQAWREGNAARALELAQQHAQRHPRSALALERDALRVITMCALGRKSQARPLALDVIKRAPRSPLRASVEESCGLR